MTTLLSPKDRLLRTLAKQSVDRPPVICPGGMMNSAVVEIMKETGHTLPSAHLSWELMTALAADVQNYTSFENFGIPFCMTIEAEVLGSEINYGSLECEPKIQKEIFNSVKEVNFLPQGAMSKNHRVAAVVQSIYNLSKINSDIPVIGSLTGPLSTAASLVDPMQFLKGLRREAEASHRFMDYVCDHLIEYAKLMKDNGASVISIADPTATGEILGPKMFEEYAVTYLNKLIDRLHEMKIPVIVHICGRMEAVKPQIAMLHGDALSVDAFVSLKNLKSEISSVTTMGNLSTYLLEFGTPDKVYLQTERLLADRIDIIAPACGLSTSTPLDNIKAFTKAIIERHG
ncbi:MAG: methylcobamide--CoM methyltransferase [Clostridiales bacterium GWB2_37_7]|nr:MAG: methylcobamide--CoM methyltransferase [Clostridiales bacterium GWB2_37_7]